MKHPSPAALLELQFDEAVGAEREAVAAHTRQCPTCGLFLDEVRQLEQALAAGPEDVPPPDGLERVLARVDGWEPIRRRRAEWARVALPSVGALLAGTWATRAGADWLAAVLPAPYAGSAAGAVLAVSLSALAVVALGVLITLAAAPVLILESRRGS